MELVIVTLFMASMLLGLSVHHTSNMPYKVLLLIASMWCGGVSGYLLGVVW